MVYNQFNFARFRMILNLGNFPLIHLLHLYLILLSLSLHKRNLWSDCQFSLITLQQRVSGIHTLRNVESYWFPNAQTGTCGYVVIPSLTMLLTQVYGCIQALIISRKSNKLLFVSKWRKAKKMIAKIWISIFWVSETRLSHSIKRGEITIKKNVVGLNDYSNPPFDTRPGFFFATTILISQSNFSTWVLPEGTRAGKGKKS